MDALAHVLREALKGMANVIRPVKKGEIRITGLEDSVTQSQVRKVVALLKGYLRELVKPGRIGFGPGYMGATLVM